MEIRSVKKRKVSYPKMREVSVEKVKKAIPNTWVKLGITALVLNVLMGNKVWGISETDIFNDLNNPLIIAGAEPTHIRVNYFIFGCNLISFIAFITAAVSAIVILRKKIKYKKDNTIKLSKIWKIIFVVSILLFVLLRLYIGWR